jgi:hypothetical protein
MGKKHCDNPRTRVLGTVSGLKIYLVCGQCVRDVIDLEFTMGGNHGAYPKYVPKGEIWLDDAMNGFDATATCLHELVERDQMLHHHLGYDRAHVVANSFERPFRKELIKKAPAAFDAKRVQVAFDAYLKKHPAKRAAR